MVRNLTNSDHGSTRQRRRRGGLLALTVLSSFSAFTACAAPPLDEDSTGDGDGDGDGDGGTSSSGGASSSGGSMVLMSTGSTSSTGSATSTGGGSSSGGSAATGGSGSGGSPSSSCVPNPCQNGGTCDNSSGSVECTCAQGYGGPTCATLDCTGISCDGDGAGTCDDTGSAIACLCESGYQDNDGDLTCNTACDAGSCTGNNEVCDDSSGTAMCQCEAGYVGENCDQCDTDNGYQDAGGGICERAACADPGAYDFEDDFDFGLACWTSVSGTWALLEGGGVASSDGYEQTNGTGANIATATPGPYNYVRVEAQMKVTAWGGDPANSWAGVFARYSGASSFYAALVNGRESGGPQGRLYQGPSTYRGGTQNAGAINLGQWYDIAVELRDHEGDGSRVELVWEFNGTQTVIGDYSDGDIAPGAIGVGTLGGAQAVFDDVVVTVLD